MSPRNRIQNLVGVIFLIVLLLAQSRPAQGRTGWIRPTDDTTYPPIHPVKDPQKKNTEKLRDPDLQSMAQVNRDISLAGKASPVLPGYDSLLAGPPGSPADWVLTFSDEFSGTVLNRNVWSTEYGFDTECIVTNPPPVNVTPYCNRSNNDEKEWYVDDAPRIENGILKLTVRKNDCSGDQLADRNYAPYRCDNFPYLSGMVSTHGRFSQRYGYFEARMKIPAGNGFWPAFWLMPQLPKDPLSPAELYWPPEIDIMEAKGQEPNNIYMTHIFSGAYPDPGTKLNNWPLGGLDVGIYTAQDFTNSFHLYAVAWDPDVIIWYVDGLEQFRSTLNLPPGRLESPDFLGDMHIILNLAVGGSFVGQQLPDDALLPNSLDVDYVRVYSNFTKPVYIPLVIH